MYLLLRRRTVSLLIPLLAVLGIGLWQDSPASPADCLELQVVFEGREYVYSLGDTSYYRWTYTVVADSCIGRALSYWVLAVCDEWLPLVSEVSTLSVDESDPSGGNSTYYAYELGTDPKSGVTGIKWELVSGNELDTDGEFDTFSFVSPGWPDQASQSSWVGKGGQLFDGGITSGPGCGPGQPVPVEEHSWGRVKSLYR